MVVLWKRILCCGSSEQRNISIETRRPVNSRPTSTVSVATKENFPEKSVDPPDVVSLSETPKVKFWKNRTIFRQDDFEVFEGTFGNSAVSVKRVARKFQESEGNILSKLDHENIIQFLCKIEDAQYFYIVTEDVQVSLENYLQETRKVVFGAAILTAKEIMQQLTGVMSYLFDSEIIFSNLNPQSVRVLTRNKIAKVKLTNFENSLQGNSGKFATKAFQGVEGFVAPEGRDNFGYSSNIYSLGCLFFYVLTQGDQLPQVNIPNEEAKVISKLHMLQAKQKTADVILCVSMMRQMLMFNSNERLSIYEVKIHPYFWGSFEIFNLILNVCKKLEGDTSKEFREKLEAKKTKVIGSNWTESVDKEIIAELSEKRNYDGNNLHHLVQAIRNQIVHKSSPLIEEVMGKSNEKLLEYWLGKFPNLVPHLCRVMDKRL